MPFLSSDRIVVLHAKDPDPVPWWDRKADSRMSNLLLHIKDALEGASPGTLIASPETTTLHGPLRALIGKDAANLVLKHAGRPGVLHMDSHEIAITAGIELHLAERLVAARRLFDACRHPASGPVQASQQVLAALPIGLATLETEVLLAVALNARMLPIATVLLSRGGSESAAIVPRDVFTPLVRLNARCFVLVHNHPSGAATPSQDDILLTNSIAKLGYAMDLHLVDHLIVGGTEICSFADMGLLPNREDLRKLEVNDGL